MTGAHLHNRRIQAGVCVFGPPHSAGKWMLNRCVLAGFWRNGTAAHFRSRLLPLTSASSETRKCQLTDTFRSFATRFHQCIGDAIDGRLSRHQWHHLDQSRGVPEDSAAPIPPSAPPRPTPPLSNEHKTSGENIQIQVWIFIIKICPEMALIP